MTHLNNITLIYLEGLNIVTAYFRIRVLHGGHINPLNKKRRLLYLKTQFVPRSKHFSSRL